MEMCLSFLLQLRHAHSISLVDQPLDTSGYFLLTLVRSAPHMVGLFGLVLPQTLYQLPCSNQLLFQVRAKLLLSLDLLLAGGPIWGTGWLPPSLLPASLCYDPVWLLLHPPHFPPKNMIVLATGQ